MEETDDENESEPERERETEREKEERETKDRLSPSIVYFKSLCFTRDYL